MKQLTESQWKQLMKSANVSEFKAECLLSNASNRDSCTCWIVYSIVFARTLVWQDAGSLFIRETAEKQFHSLQFSKDSVTQKITNRS